MKRQFQTFNFSIRNQANDTVDINIDGAIVDAETQEMYEKWYGDSTSVSFKSFRTQLDAVNATTINVYINSGGGLVTDAMAIHDLLVDLQAKGKTVNTIGRGIIASAATYILMAGKTPEMSANSWFMIHNVSGWAWGDVNEVEKMAKTLRKFNDTTRDFYANATGKRPEDITKMMNAETWMTADEAKENGFISKVSGETNFTNSIPAEHWQFTNMAVLNSYNAAVKQAEQAPAPQQNFTSNQFEDMKKIFTDLSTSFMNAIKGIKAPENNDHTALMNSIAETFSNQFNAIGDQMETAVNDAVKTAVEEATKDVNQKLDDLEKANNELKLRNEDLDKELTNAKGKQTTSNDGDDTKVIGSFS